MSDLDFDPEALRQSQESAEQRSREERVWRGMYNALLGAFARSASERPHLDPEVMCEAMRELPCAAAEVADEALDEWRKRWAK